MTNPPVTPSSATTWIYRLWLASALAATATTLVFFVIGIGDGSISSFNAGLWLVLLAIVIAVPVIGWRLRAGGKTGAAIGVLSVLAVPGLFYLLFLVLVVASGTSWR